MERILHDVKKTLYPRLVLYDAIAGFKPESRRPQPSIDPVVEYRRNFLDSFSYLCDVEKGGKTVTAAELQKLPQGNILWLAANEGIRNDVKAYADDIWRRLMSMEPESMIVVWEYIFQRAVQMCTPRLAFYKELLKKHATNCRMQLRSELPQEEGRTHPLLDMDIANLASDHSSEKTQEAFRATEYIDPRWSR